MTNFRKHSRLFLSLNLVVVSALTLGVGAQSVLEQGAPNDVLDTPYSAGGEQLSFYFSAKNFLITAHDVLAAGEAAFNYNILRPMDLEPGTKGAEAVERAALLGRAELLSFIDLRPYTENPEEYNKRQERFQRERVRRVTRIFNTMLVDVQASGADPTRIIDFIEEKIRPNVSLMSDKPDFLESENVFRVVEEEFFLITGNSTQETDLVEGDRNEQ